MVLGIFRCSILNGSYSVVDGTVFQEEKVALNSPEKGGSANRIKTGIGIGR